MLDVLKTRPMTLPHLETLAALWSRLFKAVAEGKMTAEEATCFYNKSLEIRGIKKEKENNDI